MTPGSRREPPAASGDRAGGGRGIEHVDARLRHLAAGATDADSPLDPSAVALELERLAHGYRHTPDETRQAAGADGDAGVDVAAEIAACYQYAGVDNQRFARRLEAVAEDLRHAGDDGGGG